MLRITFPFLRLLSCSNRGPALALAQLQPWPLQVASSLSSSPIVDGTLRRSPFLATLPRNTESALLSMCACCCAILMLCSVQGCSRPRRTSDAVFGHVLPRHPVVQRSVPRERLRAPPQRLFVCAFTVCLCISFSITILLGPPAADLLFLVQHVSCRLLILIQALSCAHAIPSTCSCLGYYS